MTGKLKRRFASFHSAKKLKGTAVWLCAWPLVWLAATAAHAAELDQPTFSVRGFGTLGAVYSADDDADFVGNFYQPDGAGHTRSLATSVDSKVGLQLDVQLSDSLKAVVQGVSQYDQDGRYTPGVEWAYVDYGVTSNFSIRLGRMVAPTFMESETRLVGYTFPWIRPPQEVYGLNPQTNKEGVELSYHFMIDQVLNRVDVSYGTATKDFAGGSEAESEDIWDIEYIAETAETSFRVAYMSMKLNVDSPDLNRFFGSVAQFGETIGGFAGQRAVFIGNQSRDKPTELTVSTLGIAHNPGNWLLRAEWARSRHQHPTVDSDTTGWYITAGYRFGQFTPYISAANRKLVDDSRLTIPVDGMPPQQTQVATALNEALEQSFGGFLYSQKRFSAGLRWDVLPSMDIKFQLEHLRPAESETTDTGFLTNVQEGFTTDDTVNVFGIAVDFVF